MRGAVIGIGNVWRRDDGAGPAAVACARLQLPEGIAVIELDGEPARLLDAWDDLDLAVVVDAIRSDDPVGSVRRIEVSDEELPAPARGGSHSLGLAEAVRLGRALGRMPRRLLAFGIAGGDFSDGRGLTPSVQVACVRVGRELAAIVTDEVEVERVGRGGR